MSRYVVFALVVACGGRALPSTDASVADSTPTSDDANTPSCASDASMNPACNTGLYAIECSDRGCLTNVTNDPQCPLDDPDAGCMNICNIDEFGAWCGWGGASDLSPPSTSCRQMEILPSATAIYCCKCGS